jgi:hypothetical protein
MQNKFNPKGRLKELTGSVLMPENSGLRLVFCPCSKSGNINLNLQKAVIKKWGSAKTDYKSWFATRINFEYGHLITTAIASDTWIVSTLIYDQNDKLESSALESSIKKLSSLAKYEKGSVHFHKQLFDESPALIELVNKYLIDNGINVYIYQNI